MNFVSKYESLFNEKLIKIMKKKSLAYRISDETIATSPYSVAFGMRRDSENDKFIVEKSDLPLKLYNIKTSFTKEVIQDLEHIFKDENAVRDILVKYVENDLIYEIDKDFLTLLKNRAAQKDKLTIHGDDIKQRTETAALMILIRIHKILNDFKFSDNRSEIGFAVVNSDVGALIAAALSNRTSDNENDDSPSYIGRLGGIDFYIDFTNDNSGTDAVICGMKGNGITEGSVQLQRYPEMQSLKAIDAASGEPTVNYFFRVGMAINPIDNYFVNNGEESQFVGKFDVDVSDLEPFKVVQ